MESIYLFFEINKYFCFDISELVFLYSRYSKFYITDIKQDKTSNSLLYDFDTKYIYDLTGSGIDDSKKKVWRLNPGDTYEEWSLHIKTHK